MSNKIRQAICCVCGEVRTCHRPRSNHREENYWLRGPVDRDWHRETGDLKCAACGRTTTHALLLPEGDPFQDHAESLREFATGWSSSRLDTADKERIRKAWRQGRDENPYLRHRWFVSDADKAREAGQTHLEAICKARIPVPKNTSKNTTPAGAWVKPAEFHDVDREDPETGLYWYDGDCVDCLNRWNAMQREEKRNSLRRKLTEVAAAMESLDDRTVEALLAQINGDGA